MPEAHVVIVTPELWGLTRENGGISTSVFHFARLFRQRGDRVTVLVGLAKEASVAGEWARRYEASGIEIRTAAATHPRRGVDGAPYAIDFPFRCISEAVADALPADADIVYFQDWCALGFETLRRRALGMASRFPPAITVLRGSSVWARPGSELLPDDDASRQALDRAERFAVEQSDHVVSPSQSYHDLLSARQVRLPGNGRTRVLRHPWLPLHGRLVEPSRPADAFVRLVYFGVLSTRKGLDLFLDTLTVLNRSSDLLAGLDEIVFVGREGEYRRESLEAVAEEVASLGLRCSFLTHLDSWTAGEYLAGVAPDSLVVLPSLRENFPNAVIEASLVPGLNALFSDIGGVSEMFGDRRHEQLFAPDTESLAAALDVWLRRGPLEPGELVAYDWQSANARWLAFHADLLGAQADSLLRTTERQGRVGSPLRGAGRPRLGVVLSTYEWPEALDAVLRSLAEQSDPDFDLVVADDGSGPETHAVVERWRPVFGDRLDYVWQADEGFRLARVLDLGVLASDADYLVVLHGESIVRRHFLRVLRKAALPGWFVAGRRIELSPALTERVLREAIDVHRWPLARWLRVRGDAAPLAALTPRDRRRVGTLGVPEFDPVNRGFGYLLGVARSDFERVNGYDTRFVGWGEEDVDLAVRLRRLGLRCGHAGPDATLIHLWHESREVRDRPNWWLLQETEQSDRVEAIEGLRELAAELQVSANRVTASSSSTDPAKS